MSWKVGQLTGRQWRTLVVRFFYNTSDFAAPDGSLEKSLGVLEVYTTGTVFSGVLGVGG